MKKFILKAGFDNPSNMQKAINALTEIGVSPDDMDYHSSHVDQADHDNEKGLTFKKTTKSPFLAAKFFPIGGLFGLIFYLLALYENTDLSLLKTLENIDVYDLLFAVFGGTFIFFILGRLIGKRYGAHLVTYSENDDENAKNIFLAVDVNGDKLEEVKECLQKYAKAEPDVIDAVDEVELGLRNS